MNTRAMAIPVFLLLTLVRSAPTGADPWHREIMNASITSSISSSSNTALPTYIPPPPIDITPELIQQSLSTQDQKTAIISSIVPHFLQGVITFGVQLTGLVANTLFMNSSSTLPCGSIGSDFDAGIVLVPQTIKNGTPQVTIETCLVIAVNVYHPGYITWWVVLPNGTIKSVLSDNKVHDIDRIDPNSAQLTIIPMTPKERVKREYNLNPKTLAMISKRGVLGNGGLDAITPYTATMDAAACQGISCINTPGTKAFHHPFLLQCFCRSPAYIETNPSGESEPSS